MEKTKKIVIGYMQKEINKFKHCTTKIQQNRSNTGNEEWKSYKILKTKSKMTEVPLFSNYFKCKWIKLSNQHKIHLKFCFFQNTTKALGFLHLVLILILIFGLKVFNFPDSQFLSYPFHITKNLSVILIMASSML